MKRTEEIFFSLIRSAVGTGHFDGPVSLSRSQWEQMLKFSVTQYLAAMVFRELSHIGNNMPEELKNEWKSLADFSLAMFDAQLMAMTHLSQFLEGYGIETLVLKGLGLALLYPEPQCRECSDVDVFCFGQYERVNALLQQEGLISGIDEENDKHCNFSFDGVNVENHRYFNEYVNRANVLVDEEILRLSGSDLRTDSRIPGISFPGPLMGALHLTMHTLSHLAWSGITVRHLLDCGLYFNRNKDAIDRDAFFKVLEDAGVAHTARSLFTLCEDLLGLDTGMTGTGYGRKDADTILNGILNPIRSSSEFRNPLSKFFCKYRRFRYRSSMHRIVYGEPFPDPFWMSFSFLTRWKS